MKNGERIKALSELVPWAKYPLELCEAELEDKESWVTACCEGLLVRVPHKGVARFIKVKGLRKLVS